MTAFRKKGSGSALEQIVVLTLILLFGFGLHNRVRSASTVLNNICLLAFYALPFLFVRPVRRLRGASRACAWILLAPLLLRSALLLLIWLPEGNPELTKSLQVVQLGNSTLETKRWVYGGAVGPHGVLLEQRRAIAPGLFLIRLLDDFPTQAEVTISGAGPATIAVHTREHKSAGDLTREMTYTLKPWVYF